jgi:hypothetical protein
MVQQPLRSSPKLERRRPFLPWGRTIAALQNIHNETVTFAFVAGGAGTSAGQYLSFDNVELRGALTAVPEPTTLIAGALLLLPLGVSTVRILRRRSLV